MPVHRNSGHIAMVKGTHMTVESRALISKANLGKHMSMSAREKIAAAKFGHIVSEETRQRISAGRKGIPCSEAAKEATRKLHTGERKSAETRAKMSAHQLGAGNHQWRGGVTPEEKAARNRPEYAAWRTAVFERDDYTCPICNKRGADLEAHHIQNFSAHKDERLDVANGVTMCVPCHERFHLIFGKRHNTLQELQTFVMALEA